MVKNAKNNMNKINKNYHYFRQILGIYVCVSQNIKKTRYFHDCIFILGIVCLFDVK